jgi:putative inorganic carbon (hco3(-)) transporter
MMPLHKRAEATGPRRVVRGRKPAAAPQASPAVAPDEELRKLYSLRPRELLAGFRKESVAFWFASLYILFEYVRPQSLYPAIDVLPWVQTVVLLGLGSMFIDSKNNPFRFHGAHVWIIAFTFWAVCSGVASSYPANSFKFFASQMFPWVPIYFLIGTAAGTRARFFLLFGLFLLFSFKMSQHGFITWAKRGFRYTNWGITGAPGFFHNAGEVGIQMCIFLPMSLCFIMAVRQYVGRITGWLLWLLPVTAAGTVIASASRGAVLGSAVALAWLLISLRKLSLKLIIGTVVLASVAWAFAPPEFVARFSSMGEDNTSQSRLTYWKSGWELLQDHPAMGIGFGNWLIVYPERFGMGDYYKGPELPHNIFVQVGAEMGWIGLIFYVGLIVTAFALNRSSRKLAQKAGDAEFAWLALGMNAGLVGFLVSAQFVTVTYYPYFWIALAMSVALNSAMRRAASPAPAAPARAPAPAR